MAYNRLNPLDSTARLETAVGTLTAAVLSPHLKSPPKASDYINDWYAQAVRALRLGGPKIVNGDVDQDELWNKLDLFFFGA